MSSSINDDAHETIREYVQDVEWDDPFWLDDVQEQFPTLSAAELEDIYRQEIEKKLGSEDHDGLERLYQAQMDQSPDSRNYFLLEVLEKLM